jgi:hypothetical protein
MKKALSAFLLLLTVCVAHAQKKVFQEISEDIQSQVKAIYQDNSVVGYVVFTQLEKASADSFNYKITIMDENLNDIGVVKFKESKLVLYGVTFEQDVLCLAYFKSNFYFNEFKTRKEYKQSQDNEKSFIFTQFLSLDGKIINSNDLTIRATTSFYSGKVAQKTFIANPNLKQSVFLRNIPGKGFAILYGDESKNSLIAYNTSGNVLWQKTVKANNDATLANMLTNGKYIYTLIKNKANRNNGDMYLGCYEVLGYSVTDSSSPFKHVLKDKEGNSLAINAFDNDPVTGNLYISGGIIDPKKGNTFATPKTFSRGTFSGVYTINFNGTGKNDINEVYSYWNDGSQSLFSKKGRHLESNTYTRYDGSFKDYQGNTYFYGSSFTKRTRWGLLTSSVLIPIWGLMICNTGYVKVKINNTMLLKQNDKGALSADNTVKGDKGGFFSNKTLWSFDTRSYRTASDPETKNTHLIIDDKKNIFIYSTNAKKVIRTIPHKDGGTFTYVFPAKEGHIMVSEYNKKAKSTTVSIESL